MRDWRKIILLTLLVILSLTLVGVIIYFSVTYFLKEERPPLDIPQAHILNYTGEYDEIKLNEYGVNFKIKSGGEIIKNDSSYNIKGKNYNFNMEIIPFSNLVLHTDDSLKKYESQSIKYNVLENIELNGDNKEAYGKNRGDIFINKNNQLVRVLNETSYINNDIPVGSIEVISGDIKEIYKIYITYFGTKQQEQTKELYTLNDDDRSKGLEYHNYYQANNSNDYDLDIIGFGGVYNDILTEDLNKKILDKTNTNFQSKHGVVLEKNELEYYKQKILLDKNKYFNAILFKRIIIKNNNIYLFNYEALGVNLELVNIFNNKFDNFFFKDIKINEPIYTQGGNQEIFENMQFIVPNVYTKKEHINSNEKFVITPTVKLYKNGNISIKINRKEDRKETKDDVYNNNITKYITDSLAISDKTITKVDLLKSSDINLGGFDGKGNIFKVSTTNKDDIIYIEYVMFDKDMYYTIGFSYSESEKDLTKYFEDFIKSIKKIK